jgi:hypothetical protein
MKCYFAAASIMRFAFTSLKAEGLIRAEVGLGSFVAKRPAEEAEPPA